MKKPFLAIAISIFSVIVVSCNSANSTKTENAPTATSEQSLKDSAITITAKYISGGSLEGDAVFIFEKEDGSQIEFYRNYNDANEPELKYEFLSDEGVSGNKALIDSMFIIKYKVNPKGQISMVSGEGEPCNQILSIEKK